MNYLSVEVRSLEQSGIQYVSVIFPQLIWKIPRSSILVYFICFSLMVLLRERDTFQNPLQLWREAVNSVHKYHFLSALSMCVSSYMCVHVLLCVCACICMLCAYIHVTLWVQAALRSNVNHAFPGFKLPVRLCCLARQLRTCGYHCLFHNENSSTGYYT